MTIPRIRFSNNEQIAQAVYRYIRTLNPPLRYLTVRVSDPSARKFSAWWLVPTTDWPVYRYAKLLFTQWIATPGALFVGFQVEKGLGRQLPGIVKTDLMMQPGWDWHKFLNNALAGMLDQPMREVLQRSGLPLTVRLNLYDLRHVPDPDSVRKQPDEQLEFVVRTPDLGFEMVLESTDVLEFLNGAFNLRDLVGRVLGLQNMTWYWLDWMMGVQVRYSDEGTGDWGVAELWDKALAPWLRWLR